jgi:hypothetical protein
MNRNAKQLMIGRWWWILLAGVFLFILGIPLLLFVFIVGGWVLFAVAIFTVLILVQSVFFFAVQRMSGTDE